MLNFLFATDRSWILLVQRLVLALVLLPHGAQKLLGWFGGPGFDGTMAFFTDHMGMPPVLALLTILTESLGAVALVLGLGTRLVALGVTSLMVGAVALVHGSFGFFMNWDGSQLGEGFEYHLLALGLAVPLALAGGGSYALDRVLARLTGKTATTTVPSSL